MRSIELFSGAGGLAIGLHLAGFSHQLLVESDNHAFDTLLNNSQNEAIPGISNWRILNQRVENTDFADYLNIDLLAAGIPCQPFSNGGKRKGLEDERNMFPTFAKALATVRPKAFLLENVSGLAGGELRSQMAYVHRQLAFPSHLPRSGQTWEQHSVELERLLQVDAVNHDEAYQVVYQTLNTADYGVPQLRKRVFLVGFRRDLQVEWGFPSGTHTKDALLHEQWVTGEYWKRHGIRRSRKTQPSQSCINRIEQLELGDDTRPWRTVRDAIGDLSRPSRTKSPVANSQHVRIPGARVYAGHTGSMLDHPAKTIKAGVHGVPGGENMVAIRNGSVRYFTVRECARIQTFPDSWAFCGDWSPVTKQLGNAVAISLGRILAGSIRIALVQHECGGVYPQVHHGPPSNQDLVNLRQISPKSNV